MSKKLNSGDVFPKETFSLSGGGALDLPAVPDDGYQIVLIYRGSF